MVVSVCFWPHHGVGCNKWWKVLAEGEVQMNSIEEFIVFLNCVDYHVSSHCAQARLTGQLSVLRKNLKSICRFCRVTEVVWHLAIWELLAWLEMMSLLGALGAIKVQQGQVRLSFQRRCRKGRGLKGKESGMEEWIGAGERQAEE